MSSSSSLVQEKGKPEMKSLCFSRVVLYLNTCKKGKAVVQVGGRPQHV